MTELIPPEWIIERDDEATTYCENPHPVRLGRHSAHYSGEPFARTTAINRGAKGYQCPGGEPHFHTVWTVYDVANPDHSNVGVFDRYPDAVACRNRLEGR